MEAAQSPPPSLGELLVESGRISRADLDAALAEQAATNRRLTDILLSRGLVDGRDITDALMAQLGTTGITVATASDAPPQPIVEADVVPFPIEPHSAHADEPDSTPPEVSDPAAGEWSDDGRDALPAATEVPPEIAAGWSTDPTVLANRPPPEAPVPLVTVDAATALVAELAARHRVADQELAAEREAHAELLRGLENVRSQLEARDLSTARLTQELDEAKRRLGEREDELVAQATTWEQAHREAAQAAEQLAGLSERLARTTSELSESRVTAEDWSRRVAALEAEAEALAAGVAAASLTIRGLENLDTPVAGDTPDGHDDGEPTEATDADDHAVLCFVPQEEGYDLLELDGPMPIVGETIELGADRFVVTKIGPSPLPFDERSCAFLEAI